MSLISKVLFPCYKIVEHGFQMTNLYREWPGWASLRMSWQCHKIIEMLDPVFFEVSEINAPFLQRTFGLRDICWSTWRYLMSLFLDNHEKQKILFNLCKKICMLHSGILPLHYRGLNLPGQDFLRFAQMDFILQITDELNLGNPGPR